MALIFQYGSNMSSVRLNSADRLARSAKVVGLAKTIERFDLEFSVWSKANGCGAANIVACPSGQVVYGVVYKLPDFLITRESAKAHGRRSMDAIEGEGINYVQQMILVENSECKALNAVTYVAKEPQTGLKTSLPYVTHILTGLDEHRMPPDYKTYVLRQIARNNPEIVLQLG
jgi:hypothetical protein